MTNPNNKSIDDKTPDEKVTGGIRVDPKYRSQFYLALNSRMLPKATRILINCLRPNARKEDKRWAVGIVMKKAIPDGAMDKSLGNTLAALLEAKQDDQQPKEKLSSRKIKIKPKKKIPRGRRG